jgi:hypothetical protein
MKTLHHNRWLDLYKQQIHLIAGTLLGDSSFSIDRRGNHRSYRLYFQHVDKDYFNFKVGLLQLEGRTYKVKTGYGSNALRFVSDALTNSNFPIKNFYYTGHMNVYGRKLLKNKLLYRLINLDALALWIADDGSLSYNNGNKRYPRLSLHTQNSSPLQIKEYVKLFTRKYKCKPSVYHDKRVKTFGHFLTFNTKDTLFLLNQLRDKHIKGMEYKFYFKTDGYIHHEK